MNALASAAVLAALIHLHVRASRQENEMATFKDTLDSLKSAQDTFVTTALGLIGKQSSGELVTDEEKAEVQAMADALAAATASLGGSTATPTPSDTTDTPPSVVDATGIDVPPVSV